MKTTTLALSAFLAAVMPAAGLALSASLSFDSYDEDRFEDGPWDRETNIAVGVLAEEEVLLGNPDGTFHPERTLNRAEFMQIVMRLLPDEDDNIRLNCFPDVDEDDWFAPAVCRAKFLGIVRGNARVGVPEGQWRFEPSRDVQYEEAVKVLVMLYAHPIFGDTEGADWYAPFIRVANDMDLDVAGLQPGDRITRGEMARLTLAFLAESKGQLDDYRDAEENRSSSSRSSSRSSTSSSRSSVMSSGSSHSTIGSGQFDPDTNRTIRSSILILGDVSPVLGAVKFFSNNEPVKVDEITVNLVGNPQSVQSLVVYTSEGELLGTASKVGLTGSYQVNVPSNRFDLPYRQDQSIYVRARLKAEDSGGIGGETVQIDDVVLEGSGIWSNEDYTSTSTGDFEASSTAIGAITKVENAGPAQSSFITGNVQLIGQFRFTADNPSGEHEVTLQTLRFQMNQTGNVTLSNVFIRTDTSSEEHDCVVSSSVITCSSIPDTIGEVDPVKVIRVYADVSSPSSDASLRLTLNETGSVSGGGGSVVWSDGVTTFEWLPVDQPVVQGTLYN